MSSTDLVEFLLARVAGDEVLARRTDADGGAWFDDLVWLDGALDPEGLDLATTRRAISEHVARHSPDRVLAECEAKRKVIDFAEEASGLDMTLDSDRRVGLRDEAKEPYVGDLILRALAQPYRDHPDWREEWDL